MAAPRVVPDARAPVAWIAAIASREALRMAAHAGDQPLVDDQRIVSAEEADVLLRIDVARALKDLGPDERRVVGARYWADLTR